MQQISMNKPDVRKESIDDRLDFIVAPQLIPTLVGYSSLIDRTHTTKHLVVLGQN